MNNYLDTAYQKALPRRFTGEPITGFGKVSEQDLDDRQREREAPIEQDLPINFKTLAIAAAIVTVAAGASSLFPWGFA